MQAINKGSLFTILMYRRGRINRETFWFGNLFVWSIFYCYFQVFYPIQEYLLWLITPFLIWSLYCLMIKRLHDLSKSEFTLMLVVIPVLGPLMLAFLLGFRKSAKENKYGPVPGEASDYYKNPEAEKIPHFKSSERIVNDISGLNPTLVNSVFKPKNCEALISFIQTTDVTISVGGGRFSMGGQTASAGSVHIDMRLINQVVEFSETKKTIIVESGVRWCDIQKLIDPYNLSLKVMQSYANFTVGGSLSVNCHGRYMGYGALISTVNWIDVLTADGKVMRASRTENAALFYGSIGCYNALGIILAIELSLTDNSAIERKFKVVNVNEYKDYFKAHVQTNSAVVFHNGDLYPPNYTKVRAVSWSKTSKKPNVDSRLISLNETYPIERYLIHQFSKNRNGKYVRQYVVDPLLFLKKKIHWINYEAGYDVAELEPKQKTRSVFILQEYFVPIHHFTEFATEMGEIFNRYKVNVVNVSIRHALPDDGSLMAWATEEVFAFVIWYKQGTSEARKNAVGVWTRELIDLALRYNGSYYLPYQVHARTDQFFQAYPKAKELFRLKDEFDPTYRFKNIIWSTYYKN